MKTQIENYIYSDTNFGEINAIIGICTDALDEQDLRNRLAEIEDWKPQALENGMQWGFGHNHFWLEEEHGCKGFKRILFVDFKNQ